MAKTKQKTSIGKSWKNPKQEKTKREGALSTVKTSLWVRQGKIKMY